MAASAAILPWTRPTPVGPQERRWTGWPAGVQAQSHGRAVTDAPPPEQGLAPQIWPASGLLSWIYVHIHGLRKICPPRLNALGEPTERIVSPIFNRTVPELSGFHSAGPERACDCVFHGPQLESIGEARKFTQSDFPDVWNGGWGLAHRDMTPDERMPGCEAGMKAMHVPT